MVSLARIQGQSLVPDLGQGLGTLRQAFGTPETRAAAEEERRQMEQEAADLDILSGQLPPAEGAGRVEVRPSSGQDTRDERLTQLNPQAATGLKQILESGSREDRRQFRQSSVEGVALAKEIQGLPDFASKQRRLAQEGTRKAAGGEDVKRIIDLQNLSEPELDLELQRMGIVGKDIIDSLPEEQPGLLSTPERQAAFNRLAVSNPPAAKVLLEADERRGAAAPKPFTDIGQARSDLNRGLITQADFDTINRTPKAFQSSVGKLIGDRPLVIEQFGEGSPQAQAIDAAIASDAAGEAPKLSDVGGIRKEFTKLSGDFIVLRDAIGKVRAAAENPSAAGDLSLIFSFMKIQDPGSTVREGEFATAQNSGGVPDIVRAQYNKVVNGERLSQNQRDDFVATANRGFESQLSKQRELESEFTNLARRQGIEPENVVLDFVGASGEEPSSAPEILRFDAQGNPVQ